MEKLIHKSLTETYSSYLLERKKLISPKAAYGFLKDVVRKGKLIELSSFLVWEVLHKTGRWKNEAYLQFSPAAPLINKPDTLFLPKKYELSCNTHTCLCPASVNWNLLFSDSRGNLYGNTRNALNTLFKLSAGKETPVSLAEFDEEIKGIYMSAGDDILFVCSGGCLHRSTDSGASFQKVLLFSSRYSYFRHNNGFTQRPNGDLFVGEYVCFWKGNKWHCAAYLYFSQDKGRHWTRTSFLRDVKINKHVHLIKYSQLLKGMILTDGDNKKKLWVNLSSSTFDRKAANAQHGWKEVNRYHFQKGGYTSMVELNDTIFFGSDYLGGTNFLVSTRDMQSFQRKIVPDPYRRAYFTNMLVRKTAENKREIWATLYAGYNKKTKSLLMCSTDVGKSWTKVIEYDGTKHIIEMISSSQQEAEEIIVQVLRRRGPAITLCVKNSSSH